MAERIVSPGVFTNERDLSFLPQGIGEIGAGIIGPTTKGKAFIPVQVFSNTEYTTKYGGKTDESYVPFCVESYLQSAGNITVIRLLGLSGYSEQTIPFVVNTPDGKWVATVLHPSRTVDADQDFKDNFRANAEFSSSYNAYYYAGNAMSSLNATINRGGSITVTDFQGTAAGTFGHIDEDSIITASAASLYASSSLSGSVIGTITGSLDGTPLSATSFNFTGGYFEGTLAGAVTVQFNGSTVCSGSATSMTAVNAAFSITAGTISGSIDTMTGTCLGEFTSSIIPISAGATFTVTDNIIFADDFYFKLSEDWYPLSLLSSSPNYIGKIFGYSANTTLFSNYADDKDRAYNYLLFESQSNYLIGQYPNATVTTASIDIDFSTETTKQYTPSESPWITSQIISGKARNLFKIIAMSDGVYSNTEVKVGILNIKRSGEVGGTDYGNFSLVVRLVGDNDKQQQVVETYSDLSLDPDSANYICRKIGDKYPVFSVDEYGMSRITMVGDYDNVSSYIRVQVDDNVKYKAYDPSLVPWGFKAYRTPYDANSCYGQNINIQPVSYITQQQISGEYNSRVYYGFDFSFSGAAGTDNENYLYPLPVGTGTGSNTDFNLDNITGDTESGYTGSLNDDSLLTQRKFIIGLQGGFDGWSPSRVKATGENIVATNTCGFDCSTATTDGTKAYSYALGLLSNQDEYDINMLLTPGLIKSLHPSPISKAIEMCEGRSDVFYIFDLCPLPETNLKTLVNNVLGMDSNYSATYHPWLKILNTDNNKPVWVPPSVLLAGVIAYNDKVAYEWYAPAGLNRGGLTEALDVYTKLYQTDRDSLYENRINPIASFPREGIAVWGQKTLQVKPSALDRINVRRMLIAVKKYIASATKYLVFENNTSATRNRFTNIVNPYLESVQQRQGLYAFKVQMDENNNTPDIIDRNVMYGQIWLQPAKTAEMIILDFNIMPTGASFNF